MSHGLYSSAALVDIANERQRQIKGEGWSLEHDDEHEDGSLADAAACYAATEPNVFKIVDGEPLRLWPASWADQWFNPKRKRRRRLVIAAALIVAEIERLDRSAVSTHNVREGD